MSLKHGQEYWLYITSSIGDSVACQSFNCDENLVLSGASTQVLTQHPNIFHNTAVSVHHTKNLLAQEITEPANARHLLSIRRKQNNPLKKSRTFVKSTHTSKNIDHVVYDAKSSHDILRTNNPIKDVVPIASPNSRMLFSVDSAATTATDEATEKSTTCAKEITAVDNNNNIVNVICGDNSAKCNMLTFKKTVPVNDACLSEEVFSEKYAESLKADLSSASNGIIVEVVVTSITFPGYDEICSSQRSRRLLQIEDVQMTIVIRGTQIFVLDESILSAAGVTNVTSLLKMSNVTMSTCSTPGSCEIERKKIRDFLNQIDLVTVDSYAVEAAKAEAARLAAKALREKEEQESADRKLASDIAAAVAAGKEVAAAQALIAAQTAATSAIEVAVKKSFTDSTPKENDNTWVIVTIIIGLSIVTAMIFFYLYNNRNQHEYQPGQLGQLNDYSPDREPPKGFFNPPMYHSAPNSRNSNHG